MTRNRKALSRWHRKHVPMRTCIACQQKRPKRELIRVVRSPEGPIEVDSSGKRSGRGAYLCPERECWQAALDRRQLQRALKCQVSADDVQALRALAGAMVNGQLVEPDGLSPREEDALG
jgi:predicted RNA-binding protein YlxR (DUF448 family)